VFGRLEQIELIIVNQRFARLFSRQKNKRKIQIQNSKIELISNLPISTARQHKARQNTQNVRQVELILVMQLGQ
jgi:hypothetical protein